LFPRRNGASLAPLLAGNRYRTRSGPWVPRGRPSPAYPEWGVDYTVCVTTDGRVSRAARGCDPRHLAGSFEHADRRLARARQRAAQYSLPQSARANDPPATPRVRQASALRPHPCEELLQHEAGCEDAFVASSPGGSSAEPNGSAAGLGRSNRLARVPMPEPRG
jgi:hypothetical protein